MRDKKKGQQEKMKTNQVFSKFNSVLIRPMRVISALMAALLHSGTDACIPRLDLLAHILPQSLFLLSCMNL